MTANGLYLFAHVLGVVLWLGTALTLPFVTGRARASDDWPVTAFAYRVNARLMKTMGLTGMVLTLLGGLALTAGMGYEFFRPFPDHWMFQMQVLGILAFLLGTFYQIPLAGRLAGAAERAAAEGEETAEFGTYRKRYAVVSSVIGLLLLTVVLLATLKPAF